VYVCGVCIGTGICVCESCVQLRVAAIMNSFVRSELSNGRFSLVLVMDPTRRRFEDRHMSRLRDTYRFVQCRPYGDSDPKSRHFMSVFARIIFLFIIVSIIYILLVSFHVTL